MSSIRNSALLKLLRTDDQSLHDTIQSHGIQTLLTKVKEFEKIQIGIQAATNRGGNIKPLAIPEGKLAAMTGKLIQSLGDNTDQKTAPKVAQGGTPKDGQGGKPKDGQGGNPKNGQGGKPSDGKMGGGTPSGDQKDQPQSQNLKQDPIQKDLQQAEEDMRRAQEQLDQSHRDDALGRQQDVLNDIHKIEARLEEILRQLRAKTIARTLAMLEAQFTECWRCKKKCTIRLSS